MELKRVLAFDEDDLVVMSAHLEGAKVLRENMAFLQKEKRFVLVAERHDPENKTHFHITGLHFDRVYHVSTSHWPKDSGTALSLIGITFEAGTPPSGSVILLFEHQCAIKLDVECLEASLSDLPALSDTKDEFHGAPSETK